MNQIKIADISITNFCNFSCDYCIAKSINGPLYLNKDGSIKVIDPRYNRLGYKTPFEAKRNHVPFENEAFNKTIEGIAHPRGHFLDLNALTKFSKKHLKDWMISISGGEPLYYPKIDDFLLEMTQHNKMVLLTNLSLIKGHMKLLDIPKDRLFFRVGFHPEQRTLNSFKHVVDILKEHNCSYIVNYILHPNHIETGKYQEYIDFLNNNNYLYEITRYEGSYKGESYSCHLPLRDWEQDIIGSFDKYITNIKSDTPGSKFILIQSDGEIFECVNKTARLGNVYENKLHLRGINRPQCFQKTNMCPSIKANYDISTKF